MSLDKRTLCLLKALEDEPLAFSDLGLSLKEGGFVIGGPLLLQLIRSLVSRELIIAEKRPDGRLGD